MDERRDLVDREELRRRIAEDPFSASEVRAVSGSCWDGSQAASPVMARLKIVELTIMRHPPFRKSVRGMSSGPSFNGGKWRRLTTQNWYVTLTTTPEGER